MPDPIGDLKSSIGDLFNSSPAVGIVNATARVGAKAQELYGKGKDLVEKTFASKPDPAAPKDIVLPKEPKKGRSMVSRRR